MKNITSISERKQARYWTRYEERVLAVLYADSTKAELEEFFERDTSAIYQKAFKMGLKKSNGVIAKQISKVVKNRYKEQAK